VAERDRWIEDLAGAILDGASIDWKSEESSADGVDRPLLTQLRLLAIVADYHCRPRSSTPPVATGPADTSPPAVNGRAPPILLVALGCRCRLPCDLCSERVRSAARA
jgi:hypothetical protein